MLHHHWLFIVAAIITVGLIVAVSGHQENRGLNPTYVLPGTKINPK